MSIDKQFNGTINQLDSSFGPGWLRSGIQLFTQQRHSWMMLMLLFFAFSLLAITLPVLGPLLTKVVAPAFTAGMMACCFKLTRGEKFKLADVLSALRQRGPQLIRLGLIYTLLLLFLSYLLVLFFSNFGGQDFIQSLVTFNEAALAGEKPDPSSLVVPEPVVIIKTAIFWLLCYVPILMLMTFAPILVWKYQLGLLESMRLSFMAIWTNRAAIWRYILALLVVIAIYLVPLLLIGWVLASYSDSVMPLIATMIFVISALIIKPILITSVYEAHKDLFLTNSEYLAA